MWFVPLSLILVIRVHKDASQNSFVKLEFYYEDYFYSTLKTLNSNIPLTVVKA